MSSYFTKMRQILPLGGGGGTLKVVSQRQNMSTFYFAHVPNQSTGYLIFSPFRASFKFTGDKYLEMDIKAFTLKNVLFLIFWGVFKENLPFFFGGGCL